MLMITFLLNYCRGEEASSILEEKLRNSRVSTMFPPDYKSWTAKGCFTTTQVHILRVSTVCVVLNHHSCTLVESIVCVYAPESVKITNTHTTNTQTHMYSRSHAASKQSVGVRLLESYGHLPRS